MLSILMPDDLLKHWPTIQPMLQSWLDLEPNGEFTCKDLLEEGMGGKRDFWIVFDINPFKIKVLLSTYITSTPQKKTWFCHLAIGEGLTEVGEEVQHVFKQQAALAGCDAIQLIGRRGFGKAMAKYGYQPLSTIFEYRITEKDGRHGGFIHQHESGGNVAGNVSDEHRRVH